MDAEPKPIAVRVRCLTKQFGEKRVIHGIDLDVPSGQVCALLGPNGAGKTTTIQMLLGLTLPTTGTIEVLGVDLVRERSKALVPTNFAASYVSLPGRLRVREALRVYADLYGVNDPKAAIAEVAGLLRIEEFLPKMCSSLSTGQQTLVLLAKALVNRPRVLFLDEPTASLDPERSVLIRTTLRRVADEQGTTILITSHNMVEVEKLADRIVFIADGRIVHDGDAASLVERYGAEDLEQVFVKVAALRSDAA